MARYLYGIRFRPRDLRFALAEASEGRSTMAVEKILLVLLSLRSQGRGLRLVRDEFHARRGRADRTCSYRVFRWRACSARSVKRSHKPGSRKVSHNGVASQITIAGDQGSEFAKDIDFMYMAIFWLSVVLFLGIDRSPMFYFAWRYRYKPGRVTPHQTHNTTLEIALDRGAAAAVRRAVLLGPDRLHEVCRRRRARPWKFRSPRKQWLWQFEYPDGTRSRERIARAGRTSRSTW